MVISVVGRGRWVQRDGEVRLNEESEDGALWKGP
jgi:hypothetical protein